MNGSAFATAGSPSRQTAVAPSRQTFGLDPPRPAAWPFASGASGGNQAVGFIIVKFLCHSRMDSLPVRVDELGVEVGPLSMKEDQVTQRKSHGISLTANWFGRGDFMPQAKFTN